MNGGSEKSETQVLRHEMAVEVLRLLPPVVEQSLLASRSFRDAFDIKTDARVVIGRTKQDSFQRSALFDAIRCARSVPGTAIELSSVEKRVFTLILKSEGVDEVILLRADDRVIRLPSFYCLDENGNRRVAGFEADLRRRSIAAAEGRIWRDRLEAGPLEDDEVNDLEQFLKLTPAEVAGAIAAEVETGTSRIAVLVPPQPLYYDRLVGALVNSRGLEGFVQNEWRSHVQHLLSWDFETGLLQALAVSPQSAFPENVDVGENRVGELDRLFGWLAEGGDRFSQVAAIELGMRLLDRYPQLEAHILNMVRVILADDPNEEGGRLQLTTSLFVFVYGELARVGALRQKPPFWRRLAAIGQASLIERQLVGIGVMSGPFSDWAVDARGEFFLLQSLVDLRQEPRWLPDFADSAQFKLEFVGRIFAAGTRHEGKIKSEELRELLRGDAAGGAKSFMTSLMAHLPGPLEGGTMSSVSFPDDLAGELREISSPLTERALAGIINLALLYKLDGEHARVVTDALRRVKYQLQISAEGGKILSLLSGLAVVAAVARSPELANEVRILTRVQRRRPGVELEISSLVRIGFIAAAAEQDAEQWRNVVGEWLIEIANEDMDQATANAMRQWVDELCGLVPELWSTCARAESAFAAAAAMAR